MPFITEEIYGSLPAKADMLIVEDWPLVNEDFEFKEEESFINSVIEAITAIRNQRATLNVPSKSKQKLSVVTNKGETAKLLSNIKDQFINLANASEVVILDDESSIKEDRESLLKLVFNEFDLYLSLDELVDYEKERTRLEAEIKNLEAEIKRAKGKLNNKGFVEKAPEAVVNAEKDKLKGYEDLLEKTQKSLEEIKDK